MPSELVERGCAVPVLVELSVPASLPLLVSFCCTMSTSVSEPRPVKITLPGSCRGFATGFGRGLCWGRALCWACWVCATQGSVSSSPVVVVEGGPLFVSGSPRVAETPSQKTKAFVTSPLTSTMSLSAKAFVTSPLTSTMSLSAKAFVTSPLTSTMSLSASHRSETEHQ